MNLARKVCILWGLLALFATQTPVDSATPTSPPSPNPLVVHAGPGASGRNDALSKALQTTEIAVHQVLGMAHDFSEILRKLGILLVLRSDGRVSLLNKQDLKETVASSRESAENFWKHVATAKDFERRKRLMASVLAMLAQLAAARK